MKEEISVDRKCIRLTICDFGKDSNVIEKRIEKLNKMLIELEKDRSGICNCINYKF
jgi:hypothetical protein